MSRNHKYPEEVMNELSKKVADFGMNEEPITLPWEREYKPKAKKKEETLPDSEEKAVEEKDPIISEEQKALKEESVQEQEQPVVAIPEEQEVPQEEVCSSSSESNPEPTIEDEIKVPEQECERDTVDKDLKFWEYRNLYMTPNLIKNKEVIRVNIDKAIIIECRKLILNLGLSGKVSLGNYIENILLSHFRKHSPMLLKEMKKQSSKQSFKF